MTLPPTAGDTLGPYVLQRVLGEGSFGVVWLAEDTVTRQKTALKISNKDAAKNNADYARNEAKVMRAVSHKSNLAALNFFETEHHCVLAMPFIEGGDMLVWLREQRRLPEATARRLFAQVCSGIEHAHKAGFVHRDIKLENLLLDTEAERVYIADWGFGGPWHADVLQNKALGSLHYSAPEICRGSYYIGPEVDVWSLGVVLYALVSGRLPFRADKNHTTCEEILIANPRFPSDLSPEVVALIKRMLEPDRSLRITMAGVLADEWMTSGSCVRRTSAPSILGRDSPAAAPSPTPSRPSTPSPKSSHGPRNNSAETMRREDKRERDSSRSVTPLPSPDLERLCTASPPPSPTRFLAKYLPFFAHRDNKHRHSVSTANSNANANANTTTAAAPTAC